MNKLTVFSFAVVLAGCAGANGMDDVGSGDDLDEAVKTAKVCPTQKTGKTHDGDSVVICEKTYDKAPFVHAPADVAGNVVTMYGGIDVSESHFVDREGVHYLLTENGKVVDFKSSPGAVGKKLHMPSNRNMYLVYQFKGTLGTAIDPRFKQKMPSIEVKSAVPAIMLTGDAIDSAQIGTWEGSVSGRTSNGFDEKVRIPIRVTFTKLTTEITGEFSEWQSGAKLADGTMHSIAGEIDNFSAGVESSDGKCIKSLADMGTKNPFAGAKSGAILAFRVAGMHFPGDDEQVLNMPVGSTYWSVTTMGSFGLFMPADFLKSGEISGTQNPHGYIPGANIELKRVSGGGAACN